MSFTVPKGQAISFDGLDCSEFTPVYSNRTACGDIWDDELMVNTVDPTANPRFTVTDATITLDPYKLTFIGGGTTCTISQDATMVAGRKYTLQYSYIRNLGTTWGAKDSIDLTSWGLGVVTFDEAATDRYIVGSLEIEPTSNATAALTITFNRGLAKSVIINYLKLCPEEGTSNNFDCDEVCVRVLPGYNEPVLDKTINFATDIQDSLSTLNYIASDVAPFDDYNNVFVPFGTITETGDHWFVNRFIGNEIIQGKDYDNISKQGSYVVNGVFYEDLKVPRGNHVSGTKIAFTALDNIDTEVYFKSEEGSSNDHIISYTLNDIESAAVQMFKEESIALVQGFYKLTFDLTKTNSARVKLYDSSPTLQWEFASTASTFEKIFEITTADTYVFRFEVDDFIYEDDIDFSVLGVGVLENCQLSLQCDVSAEIQLTDGTYVNVIDPEYTFTSIAEPSYEPYVTFCYNLGYLTTGEYKIRLADDCNPYAVFYSNNFKIVNDCSGLIQLSYDVEVNIGGIDLPISGCVWLDSTLQEATIEDRRETYTYSNGFMSIPYVFNRRIETYQIMPVPFYIVEALMIAAMDTFTLNNEEYQKLSDEDFGFVFNPRELSPVRLLVHKVGEFYKKSNC